ncbi:unnamed protein product, partial [Owenia fusiformis]
FGFWQQQHQQQAAKKKGDGSTRLSKSQASASSNSVELYGIFTEDDTQFICCNIEFPSRGCFEYHEMVVHRKFCEVCHKRLDGEEMESLMNHGLLHTGVKPFQCGTCHKVIGTKAGLNFHLCRDVRCSICGVTVSFPNRHKHAKSHKE